MADLQRNNESHAHACIRHSFRELKFGASLKNFSPHVVNTHAQVWWWKNMADDEDDDPVVAEVC